MCFAFPEFSDLFFYIPVLGTLELNTAYTEVTSLLLLDILLVSSSTDMSWTFCPPSPRGVLCCQTTFSCPSLAAHSLICRRPIPPLVDHPLIQFIRTREGFPDPPAPILKGSLGKLRGASSGNPAAAGWTQPAHPFLTVEGMNNAISSWHYRDTTKNLSRKEGEGTFCFCFHILIQKCKHQL